MVHCVSGSGLAAVCLDQDPTSGSFWKPLTFSPGAFGSAEFSMTTCSTLNISRLGFLTLDAHKTHSRDEVRHRTDIEINFADGRDCLRRADRFCQIAHREHPSATRRRDQRGRASYSSGERRRSATRCRESACRSLCSSDRPRSRRPPAPPSTCCLSAPSATACRTMA